MPRTKGRPRHRSERIARSPIANEDKAKPRLAKKRPGLLRYARGPLEGETQLVRARELYELAPRKLPRWVLTSQTQRPITEMRSVAAISSQPREEGVYLPVVRYPGLYYSGQPPSSGARFCGTFYFVEPASRVLLDVGRMLVAGSKPAAFEQLAQLAMRSDRREPVAALVMLMRQTFPSAEAFSNWATKTPGRAEAVAEFVQALMR